MKQQLWFNHRRKDLGLVLAGLRIKSPLNTKEATCIVKATRRRLIQAWINVCHRGLSYSNDKLLLCVSKLKELIPLLDTVTTVANKRANRTTEQHHAIVRSKPTRLQRAAHKKNTTRPTKTGSGIFLPVP